MPNLTLFWSICYVLYQIFRHFVVFDTLQMQTANTKKQNTNTQYLYIILTKILHTYVKFWSICYIFVYHICVT